jgi:hypothetical protein
MDPHQHLQQRRYGNPAFRELIDGEKIPLPTGRGLPEPAPNTPSPSCCPGAPITVRASSRAPAKSACTIGETSLCARLQSVLIAGYGTIDGDWTNCCGP